MADCSSFIKIDRNITRWAYYQDASALKLFIHLLLIANHEDGWAGANRIHRGQVFCSVQRLSDETGMSYKTVKRCLKCFEDTGEIRRDKYLITITNYNKYQGR